MTLFRKRMPGSMFKRLFTMMTSGVLFCIAVAGISMLLFFVSFWRNDRLNRLSDNALSLARSVSLLYSESDSDAQPQLFSSLSYGALERFSHLDDAALFVTDAEGRVLLCRESVDAGGTLVAAARPCPLHDGAVFPASLIRDAVAENTSVYSLQTETDVVLDLSEGGTVQAYLAVAPVFVENELRGAVIAAQSVSAALLPYTTEFVRMVIIAALLAVMTSFVISVIVSYRIAKPLKKMTAAAKKYAAADFSDRIVAKETYNELAVLAEAFNGMAENLAQIDASRSAFVANVSHELKTPMTIISGFIDGILDGTIPAEQTEKYLRIVSDETKRLSRLVVAMLNMSRIEAGKLDLVLSDVSLPRLVCDTLLGFEMEIGKKDLEITGLDTLDNLTVRADEALFQQVLYNLIENAVKFTPYGGEIGFSVREEKKDAVIRIRNSGRSIPPEELQLIFDRFYKVDKSRGLDAKSFGLGLYIVRGIVELHGGSITVESEPDEYTEFTIRIPMRQEEID